MGIRASKKQGKLTEAEFTKQVIELAQLHHWRIAHFRTVKVQRRNGQVYYETPVQADGAGFPDLLMVHAGKRLVVAAELKVEKRRPSPGQTAWLKAFQAAGVPSFLWRPSDWDTIEKVLRVGVLVPLPRRAAKGDQS